MSEQEERMETTKTKEAYTAYEIAVAGALKFCNDNDVILKISEGFPFEVRFTVEAPLTLFEAETGDLIAPQIIVKIGIDTTVKTRADKAIPASLLKKLIKTAEGLALAFFCKTTEDVYDAE